MEQSTTNPSSGRPGPISQEPASDESHRPWYGRSRAAHRAI
jgi:hypothetical protein